MKKAPSILNRIIVLHFLAFAGISVAIIAAAFLLLTASVNRFEESVLLTHAQTVSKYLTYNDGDWSLALPADVASDYRSGSGSFVLAVISGSGRTLASSFPDPISLPSASDVGRGGQLSYQRVGTSTFYRLILPREAAGHVAWIIVGQNLANPNVIVDDVLKDFGGTLIWIALPILALIFLFDILWLRQQFRPVVAASQAAAAVEPRSAPSRLPMTDLPREILPLAEGFNQALERLEQALRAQREFTADAAHELRTPLAILRTEIDVSADAQTARRLHRDIDAMSHVLDQLLELAELEGDNLALTGSADLRAIATEVVALMAPLALAQHRSVELLLAEEAPVMVHGNHQMLSRALRNLVENGIRHAPEGGRVVVEVRKPATMIVSDTGPGIPPSDRQLVLQRFWRRKRGSGEGAGLGLAIVAKIAGLHGGSVSISESPLGGAMIAVTLQKAA